MASAADLPTEDDVRQVLRGVVDPELGDNLVDLGMIRKISVSAAGVVEVHVALTVAGCPLRGQIRSDVTRRAGSLPGVNEVMVETGAMSPEERSALMARARWKARDSAPPNMIPANTRVIAVASGKGGVGKTSISVNLATAVADRGYAVGLLDADIAGFSVPRLLGITDRLNAVDGKIVPHRQAIGSGQLKTVSMGLIEGSGEDQAVMLRGLMLNRALQHFLEDVQWKDLDYLFIDMPPGTSDVQMGLARMLPRADLLVVTTPAQAAQQVAARAIDMARRGYLRVAGIVENMTAFECNHGERYALFGEGGGERLSESTGVPLLAQIPLDSKVVSAGDVGRPVVLDTDSVATAAFQSLAATLVSEVSPAVEMSDCTSRMFEAVALLDKQRNTAG